MLEEYLARTIREIVREEIKPLTDRLDTLTKGIEDILAKSTHPDKYLTLKQVSDLTGLSVRTLHRYKDANKLPFQKVGNQIRIKSNDINVLMEDEKIGVAGEFPTTVQDRIEEKIMRFQEQDLAN